MSGRLKQLIGIFLVIIAIAMSVIVYQSTMSVPGEVTTVFFSMILAWGLLALPELAIGLWLLSSGSKDARVGDISGKLIPLVQKEGRVSVDVAARELDVDQAAVIDAAEMLASRRLPLVYLDRSAWEIVSPKAVSLKQSLLHLLLAQRRMTFDQISSVTEATEEQILEALKELSKEGKFRGVIDENSKVVYTQEAVTQLPKAVTDCPNCAGKLEEPVLPGEEEVCPYCGHLITNKLS
ncbi:MAG: zinc ribbon domain-containing protein [Candidatus Thorarchaeota archaeon]